MSITDIKEASAKQFTKESIVADYRLAYQSRQALPMKRLLLLLFFLIQPSAAYNPVEIPLIAQYGQGSIQDMAWNPAGDVLAVANAARLWFYDTEFNPVAYWETTPIQKLSWSEKGDFIALRYYGLPRGNLFQVIQSPLSHTSIVYEHFEEAVWYSDIVWHEDTTALVSDGFIKVINMSDGNELFSVEKPNILIRALSFSPDGSKLLVL